MGTILAIFSELLVRAFFHTLRKTTGKIEKRANNEHQLGTVCYGHM